MAGLKNWVVNDHSGQVAYAQLRSNGYSSLSRAASPFATVYVVASGGSLSEAAFRDDAQAAHALALMWVITGDVRYRDKAMANLNAWATTNQAILPAKGTGAEQVQLETAWALPIWLAAADIIRYYDHGAAHWAPNKIADFDAFIDRMKSQARKAFGRNNNWATSAVFAVMAAAVYQENQTDYALTLTNYRKLLASISKTDGSLGPDYLRDPHHPQYTVLTWMQASELAWNQGDDLWSITLDGQATPRLALVLENFSKLFLGELPNPKGLAKGDFKNSQLDRQGYDLGFHHYIGRMHLNTTLPVFTRMVPAWRPGDIDDHFMAWDTLTHGPSTAQQPPVNRAPTVNAGPNAAVTLPALLNLNGTVSDDGLPTGSTLTTTWTKITGPGSVTFGNVGAVDTTAIFGVPGSYVLRLTASDGSLSAADEVSVVVNAAPAPGPGKLPVASISASSFQSGNPPANAVDGSLGTRWSAEGDGQWIALNLGQRYEVQSVAVAVYVGNTRQAKFEIQVSNDSSSWTTVFNGRSSGHTTALETYAFPAVEAQFVRLLGHGNTQNAWNSFSEIAVHGDVATAPPSIALDVTSITASSFQSGNPPTNTVDGTLATRWSAEGNGEWIRFDLGSTCVIDAVAIATYQGNSRQAIFAIQTSDDNVTWVTAFDGHSSGHSTALEIFPLPGISARYVRLLGHGNTSNAWNSFTEVEIRGQPLPTGNG